MKFSYNWLRELAPFPWSVAEFAERLTMAGVEVEHIATQGEGLDKVVVAQILKSDQHPNADRLSVCEVDTGSEKKQIVCGAKNYKVGDKVPLALAGAKLPNGMEIKRSKLRGVESDGMLCSAKELGLAEDAEGLLILSADATVGKPIREALALNDTLLELEITPNRPDLLSHWGLAREIAAIGNLPPLSRAQLLSEEEEKALSQGSPANFPVKVENAELCPRYTARIIRGLKIGPSPEWLRLRLESLGERSISNVVDITNYILHEIGQPLHAFDLKLLEGSSIIVRNARAGEKIVRLDGETSELKPEMLVIADAKRPVALAGIMGGQNTGVSDATVDILLESATFHPGNIRKTSKVLGVSSGSSYRFERGVDIELAAWASLRATQLILKICGGKVEGGLIDCRTPKANKAAIPFRHARAQSVLGKSLAADEMNSILKRLGCAVQSQGSSSEVTPPSYRGDLEREVDLIEEIARVHGIQNIPGSMALAASTTTKTSESFLFARELRAILTGLGLDEAVSYTIVSGETTKGAPNAEKLRLANPLNAEMDTLRPCLIGGLIEAAARNFSGGNAGVALFEVGQMFHANGKVEESTGLSLLLAGTRQEGATWERESARPYDFYDLKGIVEELLQSLGIEAQLQPLTENGPAEKGFGFQIVSNGKWLGFGGKLLTSLTQRVKIPTDVFFAQFDAAALHAGQKGFRQYQPWPVYPSIRRDIALTVGLEQKHQSIEEALHQLVKKNAEPKGIFLQRLELFDIFASDKLGTNRKSLAYLMIYRSPSKTLTDSEVNQVHESIKKQLREQISCEIRE